MRYDSTREKWGEKWGEMPTVYDLADEERREEHPQHQHQQHSLRHIFTFRIMSQKLPNQQRR